MKGETGKGEITFVPIIVISYKKNDSAKMEIAASSRGGPATTTEKIPLYPPLRRGTDLT
jgi:hypothetical protein